MEPLAALGLASAITQFVDFGAKVFRVSRNIAGQIEDECTVTVDELRDVALDLAQVASHLATQTKIHNFPQLLAEEAGLYNVAAQCLKAQRNFKCVWIISSPAVTKTLYGILFELRCERCGMRTTLKNWQEEWKSYEAS